MIAALAITCAVLAVIVAVLGVLYARARAAGARAQILERDVHELADDIESAAAEQDRERTESNARAAITRKELDLAYAEIRARRDPGDARRGLRSLRELFGAMSHPGDTSITSDNQDDDPTLPDRKR